jgi:predicted nucleic-acid-binding protein
VLGIDTNVLVRFLVADDAEQASRAAAMFARATAEGDRLFVAQIVVCELAWVLRHAYHKGPEEIAAAIEALLRTRQLVFEDVGQVRSALERYAAGEGDLADWLIWQRSRAAGADRVATFDRRLLRSPEFAEVAP